MFDAVQKLYLERMTLFLVRVNAYVSLVIMSVPFHWSFVLPSLRKLLNIFLCTFVLLQLWYPLTASTHWAVYASELKFEANSSFPWE